MNSMFVTGLLPVVRRCAEAVTGTSLVAGAPSQMCASCNDVPDDSPACRYLGTLGRGPLATRLANPER